MKRQRLIDTFCEIVQIDSPTGHEGKMAQYVFERLKKINFEITKDNYGNIIASNGRSGQSLLLTAHLDTVEPGRGIVPTVENGIIKSSGNTILGADNKAAVAVILEVAQIIIEEKLDIGLEVVFTLSEEIGNYGAVNLDYSLIKSKFGYAFDAAGNVGDVIVASPFYNRFDIEIIGQSAHASKPESAKNTLLIFRDILNKISLGRVDEDTLCNIGVVSGGSVRNTIPGNLLLKGEVRSFVESKLESCTEQIVKEFKKSARKFDSSAEIDVVRENGGYKLKDKDPFLQKTTAVIGSLGMIPKPKVSYGVSDANIFADHDIKVINMSDGTKDPHTKDESISTDDLFKTAKIALELVSKSAKLVT